MEDSLSGVSGDAASEAIAEIRRTAHNARLKYEAVLGQYEDFARSVATVLESSIREEKLILHSIVPRVKTPESFEQKAAQTLRDNPSEAKYSDPMEEITDKAGVRIITYFLSVVDEVCSVIDEQFQVIERLDKSSLQPERVGYQSIHFLVKYNSVRTSLPEYQRFADLIAEVQVRTILQHTWAEIEHDIQYKAVETLPSPVRRRFGALAGLIEIADREFQAIENENKAIRKDVQLKVDLGQLDQVEITRDSVKAYLDHKYVPDGRMSEWSYDWTARLLQLFGFANLNEVEECINGYDDDLISRTVYGNRLGQISRFEDVLLVAMGKYFIEAHPWNSDESDWFINNSIAKLSKLELTGIEIGECKPPNYPDMASSQIDLDALISSYRSLQFPEGRNTEPDSVDE